MESNFTSSLKNLSDNAKKERNKYNDDLYNYALYNWAILMGFTIFIALPGDLFAKLKHIIHDSSDIFILSPLIIIHSLSHILDLMKRVSQLIILFMK